MKDKQVKNSRIEIMNILTAATAVLVFLCSLKGIFSEDLYKEILWSGAITESLIRGSVAQDIISFVIAIPMIVCAIFNIINKSYTKNVILLGCQWYFMYAYGLYVFQGMYTALYPAYLVVFSLSVYSMIAGLTSLSGDYRKTYERRKSLRFIISLFLVLIVLMLTPVWFGQMMGDVAQRIPGDTYAVYILDLGIVFPAFIVTAYLLIRKRSFGITLAGMSLIKIFTLCLSWTFGEWTQPLAGRAVDMPMAAISSFLCLTGLIIFIIYYKAVKISKS